jgi:hypothetical protein
LPGWTSRLLRPSVISKMRFAERAEWGYREVEKSVNQA